MSFLELLDITHKYSNEHKSNTKVGGINEISNETVYYIGRRICLYFWPVFIFHFLVKQNRNLMHLTRKHWFTMTLQYLFGITVYTSVRMICRRTIRLLKVFTTYALHYLFLSRPIVSLVFSESINGIPGYVQRIGHILQKRLS